MYHKSIIKVFESSFYNKKIGDQSFYVRCESIVSLRFASLYRGPCERAFSQKAKFSLVHIKTVTSVTVHLFFFFAWCCMQACRCPNMSILASKTTKQTRLFGSKLLKHWGRSMDRIMLSRRWSRTVQLVPDIKIQFIFSIVELTFNTKPVKTYLP